MTRVCRGFSSPFVIVYHHRVLFEQGNTNINQTWSLVVMLMSKMAGHSPNVPEADIDEATGLLKSQKILCEAVETTGCANDIHRDGVLNMQHYQYSGLSENR
jgi:hypothetical protein